MKYITVLLLLITLCPSLSVADSRCDCSPSKRSGTCLSTIRMDSNYIKVTSDTPACSMVTWYANGNPKVTIVTDRLSYEKWLGSGKPSLEIGSCDVCSDNQKNIDSGCAGMQAKLLQDKQYFDSRHQCFESSLDPVEGWTLLKDVHQCLRNRYSAMSDNGYSAMKTRIMGLLDKYRNECDENVDTRTW